MIGKSRLLVMLRVKERAKEIAETWNASLEERGACVVGRGCGCLKVMKREERELFFYYMWVSHDISYMAKFNPRGDHIGRLMVKRD